MSISHADSTCSKLGTRSVVGRAPGNFGGRIWVPSLENMQPGCFGLGRMPRNPNRTGSRSDKLGTWQRNQDAPGKTNRHPKVPSLDDVLSDAAACSGVEAPSKTRSSTCSKLGTLNQHGFPPGILPAIKQIPSLDNSTTRDQRMFRTLGRRKAGGCTTDGKHSFTRTMPRVR